MLSGWLLLLAALLLLAGLRQRYVFVAAALLVQALGLGVLAHGYRAGLPAPHLRPDGGR
jgi:hypothetical protein